MPIVEEFTQALVRHRTARGGIGIGPYPEQPQARVIYDIKSEWWEASAGTLLLALNPKSL